MRTEHSTTDRTRTESSWRRERSQAVLTVLAVTFAASTAFTTPVGYQTNLFVYGPGGYRFTDYPQVGTPLQVLLAVVTTLGNVVLVGEPHRAGGRCSGTTNSNGK
jgi:hypothetical protein